MLNDFTGADKVYIACGYTDLRKGIDGLARLVQQQFEAVPLAHGGTANRAAESPPSGDGIVHYMSEEKSLKTLENAGFFSYFLV